MDLNGWDWIMIDAKHDTANTKSRTVQLTSTIQLRLPAELAIARITSIPTEPCPANLLLSKVFCFNLASDKSSDPVKLHFDRSSIGTPLGVSRVLC